MFIGGMVLEINDIIVVPNKKRLIVSERINSSSGRAYILVDKFNRKYFAKIKKSSDEFENEVQLEKRLTKCNILTPKIIGTTVLKQAVKGKTEYVILYEYMTLLNCTDIKRLGKSIGILHNRLKLMDHYGYEKSDIFNFVIKEGMPYIRKCNLTIYNILNSLVDIEGIGEKSALCDKTMQLVHGDLNNRNVYYNVQAETIFLDFENMTITYRIYDLCYYLLCQIEKTTNIENWINVIDKILIGYQEEITLSSQEKQCFFELMESIEIMKIVTGIEQRNIPMIQHAFDQLTVITKFRKRIEEKVNNV